MKYALIFVLVILGGCAALPLFIEDIKELAELEEEIKAISSRRSWKEPENLFCVLEPWKKENNQDSIEDMDRFREQMKNYSDYFNYHFGPDVT